MDDKATTGLPIRQDLVIERCGVSRATLFNWRRRGLRALTIGRSVFYDVDEVRRFMESEAAASRARTEAAHA